MITEEDKDKLIATLTLQLQDKEKEISVLKSQLCLSTISQGIDQDKISFALEQLEKVKEKVICGVLDTSNGFWDFTLKNGDAYILDDALLDLLEQEFDNQIEELKKEK